MSEIVKTSSPPSQAPATDSVERTGEQRLDRAHIPQTDSGPVESGRRQAEAPATSAVGPSDDYLPEPAPQLEKSSSGVVREVGRERLLLQASQIAEHLSTQYAELDRREQRLNGQLALLDQERRSVRLWVSQFEEEAEERDSRLQQQEADCTERLQQCAHLEQELEQQRQELLRSRGELDALRTEHEAELLREQSLLDNRVRFQEEHLKKSRHDLEREQEIFRRDQQRATQDRNEASEGFRLQRRQAQRFRSLLEQQELSLARERKLIEKIRRANQSQNSADRELLLNERQVWDKDRETQQAELKRQQNMLKLHAENLEARRLRLDRLRAELEDTHRKTLEMRLAVEEAWAQLAQSTGPDVAKQRVDEAQAGLSEHYKQSRDDIIQHRQELERAQSQYQKQRDEFREERHALAEWVTERTERLQEREQSAQELQQSLGAREQTWRETQERWNREKAQAEAVIRDLLKQLAEKESEPHPALPAA